jgi:soluble lytic murein transglycosylase-like protein
MRALLYLLLLLAWPLLVLGGEQKYEPLADRVRARLSRMVADKAPASMHFRSAADGQRWLAEMDKRLERRMPDRQQRLELLRAVQYEATRARLDPQLVLGVIEVESAFRKYAVSRAGARGYMQVMPFWIGLIQVESGFRKYAISLAGARGYMQVMPFWAVSIGDGDASRLFHLQTNLRFGCVILRHYLDLERGDPFLALGRYNGSRGRAEYPSAVYGARKRWLPPADTREPPAPAA